MSLDINPYSKIAANIIHDANFALANGRWSFQFELPCVYSRQQLKALFQEVNRTPNIREIVYAIPEQACRGCSGDYGCHCILEDPKIINVIIH